MKKLLFLLLLASTGAYAYNAMELCGSVGKYYLKNYCPPSLINASAGQNKTTTSAEGSVNLLNLENTLAPTTIHACAYLNSLNDPSFSQIIAGQFCSRKRTKTASSDGLVSFSGTDSFNNLQAGTSYKVAYVAETNSLSNVVAISGVFTTLDDTPPDPGGIPIVTANSYFVDSNAAGGGDGSFATPWNNLTSVNNATITTGNEVWFRQGTTYTGELTVDWSGTSTNDSIVGCYYIDTGVPYQCGSTQTRPKINGNQTDGEVLRITGDYITFKTLELDGRPSYINSGSNTWQVQVNGDFVTIDNLYIDGFGSKQAAYDHRVATGSNGYKLGGLSSIGANDFVLKNSTIRYNVWQAVKIQSCAKRNVIENNIIGFGYADGIRVDPCQSSGPDSPNTYHKVLIKNNTIEGGAISDGIQTNAYNYSEDGETGNRGGVILDNLIIKVPPCTTENGVDLKGADYWLVQGNVFYGFEGDNDGCLTGTNDVYGGAAIMSGHSDGSATATAGNTSYVTVRNNIVYDNNGGVRPIRNWSYIQNTIVGNNHDETGPDATGTGFVPFTYMYWDDGAIVGNIMTDHKGSQMSLGTSWGGHIDFNVYSPGFVGSTTFKTNVANYNTFNDWKTALQGLNNSTGNDANSINEYPNFVNVPTPIVGGYDTMDFNISGNAVDLVTYHTQTDGSGASSTSVTVDNACVFFDGLGIIDPDWIKIGTNDPVQIVSETIDCATDTFTISTAQTWANNDNVIRTDSLGNVYNDAGACQNGVCPLTSGGAPPPTVGAKKWNPGHYMMPTGSLHNEFNQASRFTQYDAIGGDPSIQGVTLRTSWASLERDTKGNYQPGFDWLNAELNYLAALPSPKRLWLRIQNEGIGQTTFSCYDGTYNFPTVTNNYLEWLPKYIRATPNGTHLNGTECYPRMWESSIADHYIDMLAAYGAEFNDHELFEGVSYIKETALGPNSSTWPGYTSTKMNSEYIRIGTSALSAFPNTNLVLNVNNIPGGGDVVALIDSAKALGIGQGGPDIAPECLSGDLDCASGFATPQTGTGACCADAYNYIRDNSLSSQAPVSYSIEVSELGSNGVGRTGGYSPTALYNFCTQWSLGCNHMFWHRNQAYGTDEQKWTTGILPFINANPTLNSTCPSSYVNGCITGTIPSSPGGGTTALTVSTNGRYFEKDGQPFLWVGDTGWYMWSLSYAEIDTYLEDRAAKGFNVIQGPILLSSPTVGTWPRFTDYTDLAPNFYGDRQLTNDDPVTLNENYWQYIDYIINKADSLGLIIALPIIWGNNLDILFPATAAGEIQADKLGELIASRYTTYDNIIWFATGEWQKIAWQSAPNDDNTPSAAEISLIRALANGINDHKSADQLLSIHPDAILDATNEFKSDSWLDFNQFESYVLTQNSVNFTESTYAYSPTKPTVQTEPGYEGFTTPNPPVDAWLVRIQAWTAILSGSAGTTYGAWDVWQFTPGLWPGSLNLEGTNDVIVMKNFLESYNWHLLAPAQSMITSGEGSAGNQTYIAIERASDNSFAVAYTSSGNSFTLNLSSMSGTVSANWVNPRTGDFTFIGNFANTTGAFFNPPGNPGSNNDWALLLEAL